MVDISLDFGMRDGRPVILRELPLEQYGLRCKLSCPECGKPLESVRRSVEHPENGWKCLRHHAGEDSKCEGYGENSCHTLSEYLLSHAIGEKMLLPAIGARDGVPPPHVSRYTENGACRVGWANRPRDCSELDRFLTAQARFFRAGLAVFLIWCLLVAYVLFECFQWCTAAAGGVVAGRP